MSIRAIFLAACLAAAALLLPLIPVLSAQSGGSDRVPFQAVLLVPADDQDYILARVPAGKTLTLTDLVAYNVADGMGHRVDNQVERYLWVGGYMDGRSVGLVNRLRLLGNSTEQWHLQTGLRLRGAPELVVSSEKGRPGAGSSIVVATGYIAD